MPNFLHHLAMYQQRQQLEEGLESAIRLYYDEHEDADHLDGQFYRALKELAELTTIASLDEFIEGIEEAISDVTGRHFLKFENGVAERGTNESIVRFT